MIERAAGAPTKGKLHHGAYIGSCHVHCEATVDGGSIWSGGGARDYKVPVGPTGRTVAKVLILTLVLTLVVLVLLLVVVVVVVLTFSLSPKAFGDCYFGRGGCSSVDSVPWPMNPSCE